MNGIFCIGRMIRRAGDWYAQLHFGSGEADVIARTEHGDGETICTLPIGMFYDGDGEHEESLVPNDEQNKAICAIVFAPEAWRTLANIKEAIEAEHKDTMMPRWAFRIVCQIEDQLECLLVPWACRACGGTEYRTDPYTDQVVCDDCGQYADSLDTPTPTTPEEGAKE